MGAFLLRHGRSAPYRKDWGARYRRWLQEQKFERPADQIVLQERVEAVRLAEERLGRVERATAEFLPGWSLSHVVDALLALRGVDLVVAVSFAAEVGDAGRFGSPRQLMGYLGLVPEERSTGETVIRSSARRTCDGRHPSPPRGVRTPRAVSASASPCSVVARAFRAAWM